jgi:hypothetical protein
MKPMRIAAAAVRLENGEVISLPPPARHHDVMAHARASGHDELILPDQQGFVTECGIWARRKTALRIAQKAGQLVREPTAPTHGLFSEDVW